MLNMRVVSIEVWGVLQFLLKLSGNFMCMIDLKEICHWNFLNEIKYHIECLEENIIILSTL